MQRFNDDRLTKWMNDNYKYVFYTSLTDNYQIKAMDFMHNSATQIRNIRDIFGLIIKEQIAIYFQGHNRSTTDDIVQFMADCLDMMSLMSNIIGRNAVENLCDNVC